MNCQSKRNVNPYFRQFRRNAIDPPSHRVAVYVDGLNLYYGLNSPGWRQYHWLDLRRLSEHLLLPGQRLAMVKYFTARFQRRDEYPYRHISQDTYLEGIGNPARPDHPVRASPVQDQNLPNLRSVLGNF